MKKIKYISKAAEKVEDRVLRFIGSTEDVDRDNEKIIASGWRLQNYRKNPVVLFGHNASAEPVARTKKVWVDKEKKQLMFDIEFPEPEVSSKGDSLFRLYSNGYMKATSIGFIPNRDKIVWGEKQGEPSITFKEQELLEISLVSVPANPNAVITSKEMKKAVEDEIIDELEMNELEDWLKIVFSQKESDNDEKLEKNNKVIEADDKTIKIEQEIINKCSKCGCELELCPQCEAKDQAEKENEFFKGLYTDIIKGE